MTLDRVGVWPLGSHVLRCTCVLDAPRGSLTALLLPVSLSLGLRCGSQTNAAKSVSRKKGSMWKSKANERSRLAFQSPLN